MQPLSGFVPSGHGSSVTPTSVAMVIASSSSAASPSASSSVTSSAASSAGSSSPPQAATTSAKAAATDRDLNPLIAPPDWFRLLVRKRVRLPPVADTDPDTDQASGLEDKEADDQKPVEHELHMGDVGYVLCPCADVRQHRREFLGDARQHGDEEGTGDSTRDRSGSTDQHHHDEQHGEEQVKLVGVDVEECRVEQRARTTRVE